MDDTNVRAANGEVIRELRAIINSDDRINSHTYQRLQMAATVGIYETVEVMRRENAEAMAKLSANPSIQLGSFVQSHPRLAIALGVIILSGILVLSGTPTDVINLLAP